MSAQFDWSPQFPSEEDRAREQKLIRLLLRGAKATEPPESAESEWPGGDLPVRPEPGSFSDLVKGLTEYGVLSVPASPPMAAGFAHNAELRAAGGRPDCELPSAPRVASAVPRCGLCQSPMRSLTIAEWEAPAADPAYCPGCARVRGEREAA